MNYPHENDTTYFERQLAGLKMLRSSSQIGVAQVNLQNPTGALGHCAIGFLLIDIEDNSKACCLLFSQSSDRNDRTTLLTASSLLLMLLSFGYDIYYCEGVSLQETCISGKNQSTFTPIWRLFDPSEVGSAEMLERLREERAQFRAEEIPCNFPKLPASVMEHIQYASHAHFKHLSSCISGLGKLLETYKDKPFQELLDDSQILRSVPGLTGHEIAQEYAQEYSGDFILSFDDNGNQSISPKPQQRSDS